MNTVLVKKKIELRMKSWFIFVVYVFNTKKGLNGIEDSFHRLLIEVGGGASVC